MGRFISEDPIGFAGGMNLYAYVENNAVNFIDPSGLLAFFWHGGITAAAAWNSGSDMGESLSLGWNAMAVDFEHGSLSKDAETTVQHAMAGLLPNGKRQTPQEAINAANNFIQKNKDCGNLAKAAHAAQDLATPRHAGKPWRGFGNNWETVFHIYRDFDPTFNTIIQAYQNTIGVLK